MVRNQTQPTMGSHRVPGLQADLKRTYDGLISVGATGPSSGRSIQVLSKQLKTSKKDLEHDLHVLAGKGIAEHQTSGKETVWYARR